MPINENHKAKYNQKFGKIKIELLIITYDSRTFKVLGPCIPIFHIAE